MWEDVWMPTTVGFDNPSEDKSRDDLDRWRFARDISEVILSTPPEWSVRIGLFGSWGAGKTTILRYIADDLANQGSVIVNFNPSFDSTFSDVIGTFGVHLIEALEKQGLYVEPKIKKIVRKFSWLRSKTALSAVEATSGWFKAARLTGVGLGAISLWLTPSGEQIKKICAKLPDTQRILVLIDDLDRTSAPVLPKFLLSLRELLDLPRFAFVLAFDDAIVAKALHQENPEWEQGEDFLEKILDFRFSLPPITKAGKEQLLARALRENAEFVPMDSVKEVQDLIPENPRKLKALVRGFRSIKTTIERHNPGEFSWTDVWLVQLLQQESHLLLQKLGDEETFNQTIGVGFRLADSGRAGGNKEQITDERTAKLFEGIEISPASQLRIKALLKAMRARSTFGLQYVLGWSLRPPALTWKEFDSLLTRCDSDRAPSALGAALRNHAFQREDSDERVQQEFIGALSLRIDELLDKANYSVAIPDRDALFDRVRSLRAVVCQFFEIPQMLNADRFMIFYEKTQYWAALRRDPSELSLRESERKDLVTLAGQLTSCDASGVFERLQPWVNRPAFFPGETGTLRIEIRDEITAVIWPSMERQLIAFMNESESFRKLNEPGRFVMFKALLFKEVSVLGSPVRQGFCDLLKNAVHNEAALRNVEALAEAFVWALNYQGGNIQPNDVKVVVKDDELLGQLWEALRSKELLPERIIKLLAIREKFIEMGASVGAMCLDEQLETQMQQFEAQRDEIMRSLWPN
jgi:hypothetical protein